MDSSGVFLPPLKAIYDRVRLDYAREAAQDRLYELGKRLREITAIRESIKRERLAVVVSSVEAEQGGEH